MCMPFLPFSCLIAGARYSSTLLNKGGEDQHPCLVPDIRGKAFSLTPWILFHDVSCRFFMEAPYWFEKIPNFFRVLIINGCWILSSAFSASIHTIMIFLLQSVHLLIFKCLTTLAYLEKLSTWLWYIIYTLLDLECWYFVEYLLSSWEILVCSFCFCTVFVWFWYQDTTGLIRWVGKYDLLFCFLEEII